MGPLHISCFLTEGLSRVLPQTYLYIPKSARAYLFPRSVKTHNFRSGPSSALSHSSATKDDLRRAGAAAAGAGLGRRRAGARDEVRPGLRRGRLPRGGDAAGLGRALYSVYQYLTYSLMYYTKTYV